MLIFSFFGQNCRVNNLATVGSITWPHFSKNVENVAKSLTLQFSRVFLLNLYFFQKSHSPCRKKNIFEKQKTKNKKGGQVIDLWWPSYWPYSIYIYYNIYIYAVELKAGPMFALFCVKSWSIFCFLFLKISFSCRTKRNKQKNKNSQKLC